MIKVGDKLTLNCGETVTIVKYLPYGEAPARERLEFKDSKGLYRDHNGIAACAGYKNQPLEMSEYA